VSVQLHAPAALLPPRNSGQFLLNRWLGGTQQMVWTFWRRGRSAVASARNRTTITRLSDALTTQKRARKKYIASLQEWIVDCSKTAFRYIQGAQKKKYKHGVRRKCPFYTEMKIPRIRWLNDVCNDLKVTDVKNCKELALIVRLRMTWFRKPQTTKRCKANASRRRQRDKFCHTKWSLVFCS
jgi:hypothetical protein